VDTLAGEALENVDGMKANGIALDYRKTMWGSVIEIRIKYSLMRFKGSFFVFIYHFTVIFCQLEKKYQNHVMSWYTSAESVPYF
jgi:hypothetical protein